MNPAVVVAAYDRPLSLHRLLKSLANAQYGHPVRLVISIDAGGQEWATVRQVAQEFEWSFGEKEIVCHEQHLGLIGNVFFCGDLSQRFGSVILLEDDLLVSPAFYNFAEQALVYYADEKSVAGISLNTLWFNGFTHHPFVPYLDGNDAFFMQTAWFQGQAYSRRQWAEFRSWYGRGEHQIRPEDGMHELFASFPPTDWFPLKTKYLVDSDHFYVFPRHSLTTNFGERGTHFVQRTDFFQVPLQSVSSELRLSPIRESVAVYDSFQELVPSRLNRLCDQFDGYDYVLDLNGARSLQNIPTEYVLTTKMCRSPLLSYGKHMWPLVANVIEGVPGNGISFCRKQDLTTGWLATERMKMRNYDYFSRHRRLGWKRTVLYRALRILERLDRS